MVVLNSKFVIPCDYGDAVSALHVTEEYITCGTLLGRVWLYNIASNSRVLLAGFSDDSVRGVYIEDGTVFATIGDQYCRRFRINDPVDQLESKFDRRSSSSGFKYVLQKFNQVTIVYPGMTTFVDVTNNQQSMCPYKIQQPLILNVCPLDAFQYLLLLSEFPSVEEDEDVVSKRKLKVVDVSQNTTIFEMMAPRISFAILLDATRIMYVSNRKTHVYDFIRNELAECKISGEIIAASVSGEEGIVTSLFPNGSISVWDSNTGSIMGRGRIDNFCGSLGFPYLIESCLAGPNYLVTVSSDYGVHFVNIANNSISV